MSAFVLQSPPLQQVTLQNPSQAFPLGVSDGNLLVLIFSWANTSGAVSSVTDTLGNIWNQIDFQQTAGSLRTMYVFATQNSTDGNCTVTINTDTSRTYTFGMFEIVGAAIDLDGTPVHTVSSGTITPTTGTLVTSISGSIIFAAVKCGSIATTPPTPWTSKFNSNFGISFQITTSPGSFSTNWTAALSNSATTILAFQQSPGPGPVIGPPPIISDLPLSANLLANPIVLQNPYVSMVSYRGTWKNLQPHQPSVITNNPLDPSFSWTFFDQAIAQATFYNKLISFHVAVQGFGQPSWVKSNAQQFTGVDGTQVAVYWDTYYQAALIAFIQAMGTRYGANPKLYKTVWTICSTGGSWNVPHTPTDVANWIAAPYNYTTAQLVTAQETILTTAATAFPGIYIQLQVGTSGALDLTPGPNFRYNAATQISQFAYANLPKFAMDRDGFDPFNPAPPQALAAQDKSSWYLLAQPITGSTNTSGTTGTIPKGGTIFGQANWPATDLTGAYTAASTNNYKANQGVPYSNPGPVISGTLLSARTYFCQVFEMYEQDIIFSSSQLEIFGNGSMLLPYKLLDAYRSSTSRWG